MGEVYEYFLGEFARAEGKRGGEFFTPRPVVRTMVEILRTLAAVESMTRAAASAEGRPVREVH